MDSTNNQDPMVILPSDEELRKSPTIDGFAFRIKEQWQKSFDAILKTGQMLVQAQKALKHGEWGVLIRENLPFSDSTAVMLQKIAENHRISNPELAKDLPPSWYSLYQITLLSDTQFEYGLKSGKINPDMTRKEIGDLRKYQAENSNSGTCTTKQPAKVTLSLTPGEALMVADMFQGALEAGGIDRWMNRRFPNSREFAPDLKKFQEKLNKTCALPQTQNLILSLEDNSK